MGNKPSIKPFNESEDDSSEPLRALNYDDSADLDYDVNADLDLKQKKDSEDNEEENESKESVESSRGLTADIIEEIQNLSILNISVDKPPAKKKESKPLSEI